MNELSPEEIEALEEMPALMPLTDDEVNELEQLSNKRVYPFNPN